MQTVHLHLGTEDIIGRVALLDCKEVGAGGTALVELLLERETLALRGDRFILRDAGAQRTVAGGRVLDIFPPTRHKRAPQRLALLDKMRTDDPAVTLAFMAGQAEAGIDLARFAVSWNLSEADAEALWQRAGLRVIGDGAASIGIAQSAWVALQAKLLDALAREHERAPDMIGVEPERLRRMTSVKLPRPAFDALCAELLGSGMIAQTRAWLHLPAHRASVTASDRDLFTELKPLLEASPYNPPRVRDVCKATGTPEATVRQLFKGLARAGELYPVAHDHYFTASAVAQLADIVRQLNEEHGAARAAPLRDIIFAGGGGGRKVAIRILEFFDRIGYTRRVRDDHVLRREGAVHHWTAQ
jgi:selenocysteine-specific elongation factor